MRKFTNLLKLETKRFFSRKNIFTIVVLMLTVAALFRFKYEASYEKFREADRIGIDTFLEEYKVYCQDYLDRIRALQYELDTKSKDDVTYELEEKLANAEMEKYQGVVDAWKDSQQYVIKGWYYEGYDPYNDIKAQELYTKADNVLMEYEDRKEELEEQGIYRHSHSDWEKRMAIHEAYAQANKQEPLCKYVPTGAYTIAALFNGKGLLFFGLLCAIFFLNYDAWCKEYEDRTYIISFTLPYSRLQLILARWLTRVLWSNVFVLIVAAELMLLGSAIYGTGLDDYTAILKQGEYVAVTQGDYMKKTIFFMFFVSILVVTFILMISVILQDSVNTLAVFFFFDCLYLLSGEYIHSKYNPIGLLKVSEIVSGIGIINALQAILLSIVYTIIGYIIMSIIIIYRED